MKPGPEDFTIARWITKVVQLITLALLVAPLAAALAGQPQWLCVGGMAFLFLVLGALYGVYLERTGEFDGENRK